MAHLRGDSTVGGKPIVTLDEMNEFVEQIQGVGLKAKLNKYENTTLVSMSNLNQIGNDKENNGIWPVRAVDLESMYNMYSTGVLTNFCQEQSIFQLYAPVVESSKTSNSALYFRTGSGSSYNGWQQVATKSLLTTELSKKVDATNGKAENLDVGSQLTVYGGDVSLGYINLFKTGFFLGKNVGEAAIVPTGTGIWLKAGTSGVEIESNSLKYNNNDIWHSGNLNPNNYISRDSELLTAGADLNNVKTTGYYRCNNSTNSPSKISGWAYIEVIKHSDTYVLQKIYSYDGNYIYSRTLNNNVWTSWKSLMGGLSYKKTITASNWSTGTDMYEMTVTHNLDSEDITSVIVTDENKISMFTGFQVVSSTVIKVFSATNPAGKIVINAIQ